MNYYIRCASYKGAVYLAMQFAKHYANNIISSPLRYPTVDVNENSFIFIYEGKKKKGEISASEFTKKYFTQK